jgi:putative membrane protein
MTDPTEAERRVDATRRTHLANERTYLAWLRSGLTAVAVGLGMAKVLPTLQTGPAWPLVAVGIGFCLLGLILMVFGVHRLRRVDRALRIGEFGPLDDRASVAIGSLAALLAAITILLLVVGG